MTSKIKSVSSHSSTDVTSSSKTRQSIFVCFAVFIVVYHYHVSSDCLLFVVYSPNTLLFPANVSQLYITTMLLFLVDHYESYNPIMMIPYFLLRLFFAETPYHVSQVDIPLFYIPTASVSCRCSLVLCPYHVYVPCISLPRLCYLKMFICSIFLSR